MNAIALRGKRIPQIPRSWNSVLTGVLTLVVALAFSCSPVAAQSPPLSGPYGLPPQGYTGAPPQYPPAQQPPAQYPPAQYPPPQYIAQPQPQSFPETIPTPQTPPNLAPGGSTAGEIPEFLKEEMEAAAPVGPLWSLEPWLEPTEWDRSVELGLNSSEGNAEAFSLRAGAAAKRKTEWNELGFDLSYAKATANDVETQHNALLNTNYEHFLGESRWTGFSKVGLEYDEFRAFDLRFWINVGFGYQFIDRENLNWKGRFGGGTSREFGGPDDQWVPEALFGTDFEHQLNDCNKLTATIDYFPSWEDYADYRLVAVLGWEILLSAEHDLSLKLSLNDRYDSTPNGRRPNDVNYALLLLWKP